MSNLEKAWILQRTLQDRKEYGEFEEWCTEHNPDAWMTFKEWQFEKYSEVKSDAEIVWSGEVPDDAA